MIQVRRSRVLVFFALTVAFMPATAWSQAAKPLSEKDLTSLVEFGIDEAAIVARIEKGGVGFEADESTIERLRQANVSAAVLKAIQKEAEAKKSRPAADAKPAITYEDVLKLLELGIDEDAIMQRLERSPTVFTLGDAQTAELRAAGASDRLLKALAGERARPEPKGDVTDFAIVFDCSGSMSEKTSDGQSKMAVAQKVVADLVGRVPDGMNLAFVIYGHDRQLNCNAVRITRPLSAIDAAGKSQLARTVRSLRPAGNTPIALALRTAGKELTKNDAYCGMVLVSDGKETCNGDPTAEAAALAKNPKLSFGIQVVGFDVKPDERLSLEQIAAAGKGKYFNAQTAEELTESLEAIAKDLKERAKPPVVASNRRAIKFIAPKIELPEMGEIFLVKARSSLAIIGTYKIVGINKYGEELRVPSSSQKYDIIFVPKGGQPIKLVKEFSLPERRVVEMHVEEHAGLVKVDGKGTPKNLFLVPAGSARAIAGTYAVQRAKNFGDIMILPVGEYDVYLDGDLIEEKLKVEAGKLYELQ